MQERIARGEHADAAAAQRHQIAHGGVERRRPLRDFALDEIGGKPQMTLAAEHEFGLGDMAFGLARPARRRRLRRCRRWTATDGPRQVRGATSEGMMTPTHSDPRRHHRIPPACRASWRPRAPSSTSCCRWPAARASRCNTRCRSGSAASAAPRGLADYLYERQIDLLIDATHPFAAQMSRQCGAGGCRDQSAVLRALPSRLAAGRGRPLDRCRFVADAVGKLGEKRAPGVPDARPAGAGAARRRAAALLSRAQRRSGRSAARRSRCPLHPRPRPVRHRRRARACSPTTRIDAVVAKNSGGDATYAKIAAARDARHRGGPGAPPARYRRRDRRQTVAEALRAGRSSARPAGKSAACRPAAILRRAR